MRPEVCPIHGIVGNNQICSEEKFPIKSLWENDSEISFKEIEWKQIIGKM